MNSEQFCFQNIQYIITNGNCTVTDLGAWDQPDCVPGKN